MTLVINNRTAVCAACPVFFHYISLNFPACQRGSSTVSGHHLLPQPLSVCPAMTSAAGFLPRAVIASIRPRKKFPRRRPPVFAYLYKKTVYAGLRRGRSRRGRFGGTGLSLRGGSLQGLSHWRDSSSAEFGFPVREVDVRAENRVFLFCRVA